MKVRPAMSSMGLDGAMERASEVKDWPELMVLLLERYDFWSPTDANVTIEKYGEGIDKRIGWDTHLVCVDGKAALFTDGPMVKP